ncbi:MAG: adenosylmethionine--8-amino-7-oxononanoate transaminase [Nitrospinaceae bacterium]|nr:MAG: adenosylmethionine--8-amino-7-oxononanoate transaminase [Nitrospinaceae bacterium]
MTDESLKHDLARDFYSVWHPCTPRRDQETTPPLLIDRGEGVYLIDREGRRYMDVISSWWVNLFGHNHPRLNAALTRQLEKVAHVMFAGITHRPAIDLAEKLLSLAPPNLSRVYFSDNGSTSVEVALKMSLQYWRQTGRAEKNGFFHLTGGYHGETLGALSVCGLEMFRAPFEGVLMENRAVRGPDCYSCPFGLSPESCQAECFGPMERALEEEGGRTAGVIVEPLVQGAAGMKMYPPVYLKKLQEAAAHAEVHTIYDEVAVGFGRTGSLFVAGTHGLQPTFLCLSKGITSGYLPLGATLAGESIFEAFDGDFAARKFFIHSHSYAANPLATAVACETLALLTENDFLARLQPKIDAIGGYRPLFEQFKWCGEFRQTGMIAAVELVRDRTTREPFDRARRAGYAVYQEGLKRGLFMRPLGDVVYFLPPLVISPGEIKTMMETARTCIAEALGQ